jgi:heme exporter protein A
MGPYVDFSSNRFAGEGLACVRGERTVFSGLHFALGRGGALVLAGPNGSGKSSLLKLMAGLLAPAAGTLAWDGRSIADDADAHRARLDYAGHQDAVKPLLTAAENMRFWLSLKGVDGNLEEAVRRALAAFAIGHLAQAPVRFLSAGQKRRLALARVAASPAELWLLDEPATALDRAAVGMLERALADHRAGGGIAVVATHAPLSLPGAGVLDLARFQASAAASEAPAEEREEAAS